jgi:hypothetical protein
MPIERHALLLVRMAALAGFLALSAVLLAAYSTHASTFSETILSPLFTMLEYIDWVPLWSVALYAVLLLWGVRNQQAALLFYLSLPAAVAFPVMFIGLFAANGRKVLGLNLLMTLIYPATWLLPYVAVFQAIQLRIRKREIGWTGYVCAFLIAGVYLWTAVVNDLLNSIP